MNNTLTVVWEHTYILDNNISQGFSKWCHTKKLELMKAQTFGNQCLEPLEERK
jgi:hypothetical protein